MRRLVAKSESNALCRTHGSTVPRTNLLQKHNDKTLILSTQKIVSLSVLTALHIGCCVNPV